jgi:3-dehydroshikimate dehydratase
VFSPENVYSPAGSRAGMVALKDGALDYGTFLESLAGDPHVEASLEWFGGDVQSTLRDDLAFIRGLTRRRSALCRKAPSTAGELSPSGSASRPRR